MRCVRETHRLSLADTLTALGAGLERSVNCAGDKQRKERSRHA